MQPRAVEKLRHARGTLSRPSPLPQSSSYLLRNWSTVNFDDFGFCAVACCCHNSPDELDRLLRNRTNGVVCLFVRPSVVPPRRRRAISSTLFLLFASSARASSHSLLLTSSRGPIQQYCDLRFKPDDVSIMEDGLNINHHCCHVNLIKSHSSSLNHEPLEGMACFHRLLNHSNLALLPSSFLPSLALWQRGPCFVVP